MESNLLTIERRIGLRQFVSKLSNVYTQSLTDVAQRLRQGVKRVRAEPLPTAKSRFHEPLNAPVCFGAQLCQHGNQSAVDADQQAAVIDRVVAEQNWLEVETCQLDWALFESRKSLPEKNSTHRHCQMSLWASGVQARARLLASIDKLGHASVKHAAALGAMLAVSVIISTRSPVKAMDRPPDAAAPLSQSTGTSTDLGALPANLPDPTSRDSATTSVIPEGMPPRVLIRYLTGNAGAVQRAQRLAKDLTANNIEVVDVRASGSAIRTELTYAYASDQPNALRVGRIAGVAPRRATQADAIFVRPGMVEVYITASAHRKGEEP